MARDQNLNQRSCDESRLVASAVPTRSEQKPQTAKRLKPQTLSLKPQTLNSKRDAISY